MKVIIQIDERTVTIETDDRACTHDVVRVVFDAIVGSGFREQSVADAMVSIGMEYLPEEGEDGS